MLKHTTNCSIYNSWHTRHDVYDWCIPHNYCMIVGTHCCNVIDTHEWSRKYKCGNMSLVVADVTFDAHDTKNTTHEYLVIFGTCWHIFLSHCLHIWLIHMWTLSLLETVRFSTHGYGVRTHTHTRGKIYNTHVWFGTWHTGLICYLVIVVADTIVHPRTVVVHF